MKLTKYRAKQISLELWGWLAKTGAAKKEAAPPKIYKQVENLINECPLCHLYAREGEGREDGSRCRLCPLFYCAGGYGLWSRWMLAGTDFKRKTTALAIYNKIKAWKVAKPRPKA